MKFEVLGFADLPKSQPKKKKKKSQESFKLSLKQKGNLIENLSGSCYVSVP